MQTMQLLELNYPSSIGLGGGGGGECGYAIKELKAEVLPEVISSKKLF
jgi:hypothetical protein